MAQPIVKRGEVWVTDLGMKAKVRPCVLLSVPLQPEDYVLLTMVPHTSSVQGTRFEADIPKPFLKTGVFNAQAIVTVHHSQLRYKKGVLQPNEISQVEEIVKRWLGL